MFIKIYLVFPRLPFGIVAYAFTLFWTTFVETAVYKLHANASLYRKRTITPGNSYRGF